MEIDYNKLKDSSIQFEKKLRLPLEILKIRLDDRVNFISDIIETASGRKFRTKLKEPFDPDHLTRESSNKQSKHRIDFTIADRKLIRRTRNVLNRVKQLDELGILGERADILAEELDLLLQGKKSPYDLKRIHSLRFFLFLIILVNCSNTFIQ
ncbi:MAG: hypothetical protein R6U96_10800 [Promethearchaeia archaeon]